MMTSTRIKVSFAEDFSSQATVRTKYLVLVPRNECPDVRTLKNYIRHRFKIPQTKQLELYINGFSLPNWEITEVIREDDMLCVHSTADATSSISQEVGPGQERRKREVLQGDNESVPKRRKRTKKDQDHGENVENPSDKSFSSNVSEASSTPWKESAHQFDVRKKRKGPERKKDYDHRKTEQEEYSKQGDESSTDNVNETVPSITEKELPPESIAATKREHRRKKKSSDVQQACDIRADTQPDKKTRNIPGGEPHSDIPTLVSSARSKVKKGGNIPPEAEFCQSDDMPPVTEPVTGKAGKPKKSKKKRPYENHDMSQLGSVTEPEIPTIAVPQSNLPVPTHSTNGLPGPSTVSQSETEQVSNNQSEEKIANPKLSEVILDNSNQSTVTLQTTDQSELAKETDDTKKKRKRRRRKKNKSTVPSIQGEMGVTSSLGNVTHGASGESFRVTGPGNQNWNNAKEESGVSGPKLGDGDILNGLSALDSKHGHLKFGSDEDEACGTPADQENAQDDSDNRNHHQETPPPGDTTVQNSGHRPEAAEGPPTENGQPKEAVVEQPAKDYGVYPPLNGPPRNGDIIAFKLLELSSLYCPEVSEYKEGVVTKYDHVTKTADIQLTCLKMKIPVAKQPQEGEEEENYGRFEMELEEGWMTECQQQQELSLMTVAFSSMIEPKLLS